MQIVVLGMHRSGTSLTTRLINMMGAYFGPEGSSLGFDIDNPKGYWERQDILRLNMAIFKLHDINWANVIRWPLQQPAGDLPPALWKDMETVVMNMDAHRPWVVKDPRFCLSLPYWQPMLEVPVYVIVHRDPVEIARSLESRQNGSMPVERGVALWEFYAVSLLNAAQGAPVVFASHADFMTDPVGATAKLYDALVAAGVQGLRLPHSREINAFVDTGLHRAKRLVKNQPGYLLNDFQREVEAMMTGKITRQGLLSPTESCRKLLEKTVKVTYA